jgi:acyl carrier protein
MGKTDIRDAARVARDFPGVTYRAFELTWAGPDRLGQILAQVTALLAGGQLALSPVRAWDVRRAQDAFRFMIQARHTGKLVLTIPPDPAAPRKPGTVLVTGGTGMLGGLVAGHLAATGKAGRLLLASRTGPAAPGAAALAADLATAGAAVQIAACDAADHAAVAGLLAGIPAGCPLTMVVHAAGVTDDGTIGSLTPDRVAAVLRPKADAAWCLHQLTTDADLEGFVLFSSAAAAFGSPGQGNYAAANAFLDGLAARRRAQGRPAVSLAWGLWAGASGITGQLNQRDRARIGRGGMSELTAEEGLALLDAATARDEALLVPARLDTAGLRAQAGWAAIADIPALLRGLVSAPARPPASHAADGGTAELLRKQLASMPPPKQNRMLLDLVRSHAAAVLGHASPGSIEPDLAFSELGFDSLTALELRNRLNTATGLQLSATVVFDCPTPTALVGHILEGLSPEEAYVDAGTDFAEEKLRKALASVPLSRFRDAGLLDSLLQLADFNGDSLASARSEKAAAIDTLDAEGLVRMALGSESADL